MKLSLNNLLVAFVLDVPFNEARHLLGSLPLMEKQNVEAKYTPT